MADLEELDPERAPCHVCRVRVVEQSDDEAVRLRQVNQWRAIQKSQPISFADVATCDECRKAERDGTIDTAVIANGEWSDS
jgi:hypothetical protein